MNALPLFALLALTAAGDPGFDQIVGKVGEQSHDLSCAQMQAWVQAHPQDPNAGRGLVWMAELRLADHQLQLARPLLERAAHDYAGTEWGWHGVKGLADLDAASHHYEAAIAAYRQLEALPSPYWRYVGKMAVISAGEEQLRFRIYLVLTAALVGGVIFRASRARSALWPPPEELTYALPVVLVMLVAAMAQPPEEARAVVTVALGGALLLWAHGAQLRAHPPSTLARLLLGVIGLGEAAALLYCAVVANDLWMKFAETVSNGAER